MLTRSITKQLARPARRPAATAAAVVNCASAASFATHSSSSLSTAVVSQRMTSLRRPQQLAQWQPRRLAAAPFQQRRLISDHTREAIDRAVASAPVVLFMKGTPELPQCGFSRASIQILGLQGVDPEKFAAFNVLEDAELREGIKEYSDWPTIPQLYVDNEFVGGCDILIAMHQSGELAKLFDEKKVLVAAGEGEAAEASSAEEPKKE